MDKLYVDFGGIGSYKSNVKTVNIDPETNADIICDVTSEEALSRHFEKNSLDAIITTHTIEHFDVDVVIPTLKMWKKFLKPTSFLKIVVPDAKQILDDYSNGIITLETVVAVFFRRHPYKKEPKWMQHYWAWDFNTLTEMLRKAGYTRFELLGDEDYPPSWRFDTPGMEHNPDHMKYYFPNLRIKAYLQEV